jgi:hypothetical protein
MPFARSRNVYSPSTLAMLCRVFDEAYAEATKRHPNLSNAEQQDMSAGLAQLIMDAFSEGESDPSFLKWIALERLVRQRR